jgi:hypothetical protein
MARRLERRVKKADDLDVHAVVESAVEAVRQAWEHFDDTP